MGTRTEPSAESLTGIATVTKGGRGLMNHHLKNSATNELAMFDLQSREGNNFQNEQKERII